MNWWCELPKLDLTTALQIKGASGEFLQMKGQGFSWEKPSSSLPQTKDIFSLADYTDIDGKQFQSGETYSRIDGSGLLRTEGGWLKSNGTATYLRGAAVRSGGQLLSGNYRIGRQSNSLGPAIFIQPSGYCYYFVYRSNVFVMFRYDSTGNRNMGQLVFNNRDTHSTGSIHNIKVWALPDGSVSFQLGDSDIKPISITATEDIPLSGGFGIFSTGDTGDNNNLSDLDIQNIGT